tara:strand:+ start:8540 stop:8851 length:312 start_codon:yes stop_codon:yes gene_type:complete
MESPNIADAAPRASHCSSSFEQGTRRFAIQLVEAHSQIEWDDWAEKLDEGFERSGMKMLSLREVQELANDLHRSGEIILDDTDPEWPVLRRVVKQSEQTESLF